MKIEQDYLKGLLEAFESSDNPTTDIQELNEKGFEHLNNQFIFH
jgi:hypothetical protein